MHFIYCDQYKFAIVWHSLVMHSLRVRCPTSNTITMFVWCLSLVASISCCYGVFETIFLWIELSALNWPTRQLARTLSSRWFYDFMILFNQHLSRMTYSGSLSAKMYKMVLSCSLGIRAYQFYNLDDSWDTLLPTDAHTDTLTVAGLCTENMQQTFAWFKLICISIGDELDRLFKTSAPHDG